MDQTGAGTDKRKTELLEALAELEHDQWKDWALVILDTEEISEDRANRWKDTCFKPYSQLTEEQKDQDRVYAERVLHVVAKHLGIQISERVRVEQQIKNPELWVCVVAHGNFYAEKGLPSAKCPVCNEEYFRSP